VLFVCGVPPGSRLCAPIDKEDCQVYVRAQPFSTLTHFIPHGRINGLQEPQLILMREKRIIMMNASTVA